jgi:TonB-dependent starch-binding outer membrane protein SusC
MNVRGRTHHGIERGVVAALAALLASACGANPHPAALVQAADSVDTGYGAQAAGRVATAVASVSPGPGTAQRYTRVEEMLLGRVAGVQVVRTARGGFSVRVRGAGGALHSGEPLFVVDGVSLSAYRPGHALEAVLPSDVARIDVLRDAAAAAMYGSRGANGVIVVTTRRR